MARFGCEAKGRQRTAADVGPEQPGQIQPIQQAARVDDQERFRADEFLEQTQTARRPQGLQAASHREQLP
jgi:hypothetical protein